MHQAIDRRTFTALLAGGFAAGPLRAQAAKRPNILLIVANELRGDALGFAGSPLVKTPRLDALAAGGAYIYDYFTAAPASAPAWASLLTGRYPKSHGVLEPGDAPAGGVETLPGLLAAAGYRTGLTGKSIPFELGGDGVFDARQEYPADYQAYVEELYPQVKGDIHKTVEQHTGVTWPIGTSIVPVQNSATFWTVDQAIEFMGDGSDEQPWFCTASFRTPGQPYVLPPPWNDRIDSARIAIPELPEEKPHPPTAEDLEAQYVLAHRAQSLQQVMAAYLGAIEFVDEQVGRLVRSLRRSGQLENTIVVVTSDVGNAMGEHGRMFAGTPYDGALRVPALFHYPAAIPERRRVDRVADSTCLAPTLLDLAGLTPPADVAGRSAKGLLTGESEEWEDVAFAELGFRTVRTRDWKLTLPGDHPTWTPQLFDLRDAMREQKNLYGDAESADAQSRLEDRLEKWSSS